MLSAFYPIKKVLSFLVFAISLNIFAVDKKLGDYANECSAVFLIMTMIPDDEQWKPFVDNMTNLSQTMNLLAQSIYAEININTTYGNIIDARNIEADKVIAKFKKNKNDVLAQYARCDKFREDFAYAALQNPNDDSALINTLKLPPYNVKMNDNKTALIEMVFDMSFSNMEAAGINSIVKLYENIRNP